MSEAKRILAADDSQTIQYALAITFKFISQFELQLARSGKDLLSRLENEHFDLLIIDDKLPDIECHALCSQIRQIPRFVSIPILILAGQHFQSHSLPSLRADDFIRKPFITNQLLDKCAALLGDLNYDPLPPPPDYLLNENDEMYDLSSGYNSSTPSAAVQALRKDLDILSPFSPDNPANAPVPPPFGLKEESPAPPPFGLKEESAAPPPFGLKEESPAPSPLGQKEEKVSQDGVFEELSPLAPLSIAASTEDFTQEKEKGHQEEKIQRDGAAEEYSSMPLIRFNAPKPENHYSDLPESTIPSLSEVIANHSFGGKNASEVTPIELDDTGELEVVMPLSNASAVQTIPEAPSLFRPSPLEKDREGGATPSEPFSPKMEPPPLPSFQPPPLPKSSFDFSGSSPFQPKTPPASVQRKKSRVKKKKILIPGHALIDHEDEFPYSLPVYGFQVEHLGAEDRIAPKEEGVLFIHPAQVYFLGMTPPDDWEATEEGAELPFELPKEEERKAPFSSKVCFAVPFRNDEDALQGRAFFEELFKEREELPRPSDEPTRLASAGISHQKEIRDIDAERKEEKSNPLVTSRLPGFQVPSDPSALIGEISSKDDIAEVFAEGEEPLTFSQPLLLLEEEVEEVEEEKAAETPLQKMADEFNNLFDDIEEIEEVQEGDGFEIMEEIEEIEVSDEPGDSSSFGLSEGAPLASNEQVGLNERGAARLESSLSEDEPLQVLVGTIIEEGDEEEDSPPFFAESKEPEAAENDELEFLLPTEDESSRELIAPQSPQRSNETYRRGHLPRNPLAPPPPPPLSSQRPPHLQEKAPFPPVPPAPPISSIPPAPPAPPVGGFNVPPSFDNSSSLGGGHSALPPLDPMDDLIDDEPVQPLGGDKWQEGMGGVNSSFPPFGNGLPLESNVGISSMAPPPLLGQARTPPPSPLLPHRSALSPSPSVSQKMGQQIPLSTTCPDNHLQLQVGMFFELKPMTLFLQFIDHSKTLLLNRLNSNPPPPIFLSCLQQNKMTFFNFGGDPFLIRILIPAIAKAFGSIEEQRLQMLNQAIIQSAPPEQQSALSQHQLHLAMNVQAYSVVLRDLIPELQKTPLVRLIDALGHPPRQLYADERSTNQIPAPLNPNAFKHHARIQMLQENISIPALARLIDDFFAIPLPQIIPLNLPSNAIYHAVILYFESKFQLEALATAIHSKHSNFDISLFRN